jgi:hypothetical protein
MARNTHITSVPEGLLEQDKKLMARASAKFLVKSFF